MSPPMLARCARQLKLGPQEMPLFEKLPEEVYTREMPFLNRKKKNQKPSLEALLLSFTD